MQNNALPPARQRLTSLDALRGIASCVVVVWHCYLSIPSVQRLAFEGSWWSFLLRPLYDGDAAVIIFFLLSGYVLALPYFRGTRLGYGRYVIRRFCRIYLPFAVAISMALTFYSIFPHSNFTDASEWFNDQWLPRMADAQMIEGHFLMLGTKDDMRLDSPIWTLIHEMRISLLFPLLMVLCKDTRVGLIATAALVFLPVKLIAAMGEVGHPAYAPGLAISLLWTMAMVPYFLTGILLCKHRNSIAGLWMRIPPLLRVCLFAFPFAAFCISFSFTSVKRVVIYDIAGAVLVVLAVESGSLRKVLNASVPQWLGRVSYSLYLVHIPILLALGPVMIGRMPFWAVGMIVMVLSLGVSAIMHEIVEAPAIRLGRWLTRPSRTEKVVLPAI